MQQDLAPGFKRFPIGNYPVAQYCQMLCLCQRNLNYLLIKVHAEDEEPMLEFEEDDFSQGGKQKTRTKMC